jgi:hypothetical protein
MSGTYAESLNDRIPGGTSWSAPVKVVAYPGHTVTLKPSSGTINVVAFSRARKYIILEGLILDGTNNTGGGIRIAYSGSDSTQAAHHIRIKNTEIRNIQGSGVSTSNGADFNEFINLRVRDTGLSGSGHGFYISSNNNLVEHSQIYNNKKCGIQFYSTNGGVNGNIFRYNQLYNNGKGGSTTNPCTVGLWIGAGSGTLVYNNLVWNNQSSGVVVGGNANNAKVYNNTIYGNGSNGLLVRTVLNAVIKNNIVYGNGMPGIINDGTGTILSNNLTSNPLFVDPAKGNFKLQAGSPAIDTGEALSEVKDDYVGVSRPQGSHYDIGAYEYTGSSGGEQMTAPTGLRIIDAN